MMLARILVSLFLLAWYGPLAAQTEPVPPHAWGAVHRIRVDAAATPAEIDSALTQAERRRLSLDFQKLVTRYRLQAREGFDQRYPAIVYTDDGASLQSLGVPLYSGGPGFITGRVTAADLDRLVQHEAVRYVESSPVMYIDHTHSIPATGAHLLHGGYLEGKPHRGAGAIVCIIDTGIDFTHGDFVRPDGTSRVRYLWHTTADYEGPSPAPPYDYGVEYTREDLTAELGPAPPGLVLQQDLHGHGTHVAGSAAGNGRATGRYVGMAPEADLIVVNASIGASGALQTVDILNGLNYCADRADALGRPVVINLSLGSTRGPHDGTLPDEVLIDRLVETPGRVVVTSAGNSGVALQHFGGTVPASGNLTVALEPVPYYHPNRGDRNDYLIFDGWITGARETDALTFTVTSPPVDHDDDLSTPDQPITYTITPGSHHTLPNDMAGEITIGLVQQTYGNDDLNVILEVWDAQGNRPPAGGVWSLTLGNATPAAYEFHAWRWWSMPIKDGPFDTDFTVGSPGTAHGAITVGNYRTRKAYYSITDDNTFVADIVVGDINPGSSHGPTRDHRTKPDLAAPGTLILSALSEDAIVSFPAGDEQHQVMTGTSMASPHVAGAAALLLGAFPGLTAADVKDRLMGTAVTDAFTGGVPNMTWGAGKLDVFAAMVMQLGGTREVREELCYAGDMAYSYELREDQRFALQFTPNVSGQVTGFYLDVKPYGLEGTPSFSGTGDLLYAVFDDDGGLPGNALTTLQRSPIPLMDYSSTNYFSLLEDVVTVTAGQEYHVVIYPELPTDNVYVVSDDGAGDPHHTARYDPESGWRELDQELLGSVEVTYLEGITPLPVELASFEAVQEGEVARLQWRTTWEQNSEGFDIEHAAPGEPFVSIGFVKGAGTTQEVQRYTFTTGVLVPGMHRFRLRQIDYDGHFAYSPVVELDIAVEVAYRVTGVAPNPFSGRATLSLTVSRGQHVKVEVFDVLGRRRAVLLDDHVEAAIPVVLHLDAGNLASGLYLIRARGETFTSVQQAIVVK